MMPVVFRAEAAEDLRGIVAWYEGIAPDLSVNILADIHRSIDLIRRYPRSGIAVPGRRFRRIVTLKYHFKVAYTIGTHEIVVLGIFRFQDRRR